MGSWYFLGADPKIVIENYENNAVLICFLMILVIVDKFVRICSVLAIQKS